MKENKAIAGLCIILWMLVDETSCQHKQETTSEICAQETFTARCPYAQKVFITRAVFGHLKIGRCIEMDFGYLGCQSDVRSIVGERCTGKQRCSLPIPDPEIDSTKPCAKGLVTYLEAAYICIPDTISNLACTGVSVSTTKQYLTSSQILDLDCTGRGNNQMKSLPILADRNLKLKLSFEALVAIQGNQSDILGFIYDGQKSNVSIKLHSDKDDTEIIVNRDRADLVLLDTATPMLISVQAFGCKDISPPPYTWIDRDGDITTMGCDNSQYTWQIRCIGSKWIGGFGNCTEPKVVIEPEVKGQSDETVVEEEETEVLSREILYAIILGTTLFLCVVVITTGYVILKKTQYAAKARDGIEMNSIIYDDNNTNSWTRGTNQREKATVPSTTHQSPWQTTLMRPLMDDQNSSLNKPQKYIVVDQDYINANGFNKT